MSRTVGQIVEEQVNRWRLERKGRTEARATPVVPANVVTISRADGTYAERIACEVGNILGLPVYDHEIVEHIATKSEVRLETVRSLDEQAQNRLDDYMSAIFRENNFDQSEYMRSLIETIIGLWGHGPCVLIGRGANHIVYRKHRLSVRLVASLPHRIRLVHHAEGIGEEEAKRRIQRKDAEREAFVRRSFGQDIDDPVEYDLMINVTGLEEADCAALIAEAYRRKFAG